MMNDPSSYMNQLRTFMQFYDQYGPHTPTITGGFNGMFGDSSAAQNQATEQGNRLNFAMQMAQQANAPNMFPGMQPAPDYFAGLPNQPQPAAPLPDSMVPRFPAINGQMAAPPAQAPDFLNRLRQFLTPQAPHQTAVGVRG